MKLTVAFAVIVTVLIAIDGYNCKVVQFIFGDSLSDVGNNDKLSKSLARASLPWYGIDFGNGLPNGRFSNGRTVADIIGKKTETIHICFKGTCSGLMNGKNKILHYLHAESCFFSKCRAHVYVTPV